MTSPLSAIAQATRLAIHPPAGSVPRPHLIYRGGLAGFHALLERADVPHTYRAGTDGVYLGIDGVEVWAGDLGGVLVVGVAA
jgi:hypothetical protein